MYKMKAKAFWKNSAKECAYIGVFIAAVIATQAALSVAVGIELVTVLFAAYAYTFGVRRGVIAATAFSLLRILIFGFSLPALILYLIYYNVFALAMGMLARVVKNPLKGLFFIVLAVSICTVCFTLLDDIITPLYLSFSAKAWRLYAYASLPVLGVHTACAAHSTAALFVPLYKVFSLAKGRL